MAERAGTPAAALDIQDLSVDYGTPTGPVHALDGVSLTLAPGEILGLAGESGSGKSTLAMAVTGLLKPPGRVVGGHVYLGGTELALDDSEDAGRGPHRASRRGATPPDEVRWRRLSIVMQSSMNALNPVLRIGAQLADAVVAHERVPMRAALERAAEMLSLVRIDRRYLASYPHELSGGMRQRVGIAMALILHPEVVIMDEPTTALDVIVQKSILEEVLRLQRRFGFSVLFLTHDLPLMLQFCDRIGVLYAGRLAEVGPAEVIRQAPAHPYTQGLLRAFPSLHGPREPLRGIPGTPPDLHVRPAGCPFVDRCPVATARCRVEVPRLLTLEAPGHIAACHLLEDRAAAAVGGRK